MEAVNISKKFAEFSDYWSLKIVGELNGQHVRLVKLHGAFVWRHRHDPLPYPSLLRIEATMIYRNRPDRKILTTSHSPRKLAAANNTSLSQ